MTYILLAVAVILALGLCVFFAFKFNNWTKRTVYKDEKKLQWDLLKASDKNIGWGKRDKDNEVALGFIRCAYRKKRGKYV